MSETKKNILFLSGIDFKEKSIQVIKKTPEAYAKEGWQVDYLVLRDVSKEGNYFYETPISLKGVNIIRKHYKGSKLLNRLGNTRLRVLLNKLIAGFGVFQLYHEAKKLLLAESYEVVYGYEHIGTLALKILAFRKKLNGAKTISRFQGTWMSLYHKQKRKFKLLANIDFKWALTFKSDLLIMTDDGTQGDYILNKWNPNHNNIKFWVNGVDVPEIDEKFSSEIKQKLELEDKLTIISISRLEGWKRVERGIKVINSLVLNHPESRTKIKYIIVGDGVDREELIGLVDSYALSDIVHFTGAIRHSEVGNFLNLSDVFFSFYDLSNVGNPLLEAIRAEKIIMTLNNGDTPKWITHKENGFIYNPEKFISRASEDLFLLVSDSEIQAKIKSGVKLLSKAKLWTWGERLKAETEEAEKLLVM